MMLHYQKSMRHFKVVQSVWKSNGESYSIVFSIHQKMEGKKVMQKAQGKFPPRQEGESEDDAAEFSNTF